MIMYNSTDTQGDTISVSWYIHDYTGLNYE